jgi:hypothetical protein
VPDAEAPRLAARPVYSPGDEARRTTRGSGGAAVAAVAAKKGSEPKSLSAEVEAVGRSLTKGRGGLQPSYSAWAEVVGQLKNEQQRQDLLRGALTQLDDEMGPELVHVRPG